MAWDLAVGGLLWTFVDRAHPDDRAAALARAPHRFASCPPGVQSHPPTCQLTRGQGIQPCVDALVAHGATLPVAGPLGQPERGVRGLGRQPASDLPRRASLSQVGPYPLRQHRVGIDLADLHPPATVLRLNISRHRHVGALAAVARDLTRDHRGRPTDRGGDPTHRPSRLQPGRDLHPIRHRQQPPSHPPPPDQHQPVATTL